MELMGSSDIEGKAAMGSGERVGKRVRFKCTDKSMPLQELMHFFGQLSANPFRGSDFLHRRSAQAIHRAEPPQQLIPAGLTHPGALVKNAFADSLFQEQLMIRVGEAMRLVANTLEQAQGAGVYW